MLNFFIGHFCSICIYDESADQRLIDVVPDGRDAATDDAGAGGLRGAVAAAADVAATHQGLRTTSSGSLGTPRAGVAAFPGPADAALVADDHGATLRRRLRPAHGRSLHRGAIRGAARQRSLRQGRLLGQGAAFPHARHHEGTRSVRSLALTVLN